jgi:c-di-GMP-binding flagellar brake protein YcgR
MTEPTGKNNRKHKRLNVDIPVKIVLTEGDVVRANLCNLSVSGAGITYPVAADAGVVLELHFVVNTRQGRYPIQVKAQVVHNFLYKNQYVIGVSFMDMSKEQARALGEYLVVLQSLRRRQE